MVKSWAPGTVLLDKYRVEGELGEGGMGVVLRVTHLQLGEELALKVLLAETAHVPGAHERFLREAQAAVRLRGEHVTRVSDVGVLPTGQPYMVMEYLRGIDLAGSLAQRKVLIPGEAVGYILQACEALAEAHAAGIVHRDIKPSNLFLTTRPDGSALLKVLDFGVSKLPVGAALTHSNMVIGTLAYMSPEQMKSSRDVDARADIWALGAVLFECLNGHRPFPGDELPEVVARIVSAGPPAMGSHVARGLAAAVQRCLARDLSRRFATVAELATAIAPFARDERAAGIVVERCRSILRPQSAPPPQGERFEQKPNATTLSGSAGMMRFSSRRGVALGGIAAVAAAVVVGGIATLVRSREGSGPEPAGTSVTSGIDPPAAAKVVAPGSDPSQVLAPERSPAPSAGSDDPPPPTQGATERAGSGAEPSFEQPLVPAAQVGSGAFKGDARAKAAQCAELEVRKDWQRLFDCATELGNLGARDKAREFHDKAVKETANALAADNVRAALRAGDLREAQKLLKAIAPDSVYWANINDEFKAVENPVIDDTRRKAIGMANAHDCAGLKRLQSQLASSNSTRVAAAANVKCVDKNATAAVKRKPAERSEPSWNDDSPFNPVQTHKR